jgi:hypothetical protein
MKRIIAGLTLAFIAVFAQATTMVPSTLINWVSPQSVANGGTGASSLTARGVVVGNGTSAVSTIGPGTNGQMFLGVTGGSPYWGNNPAISGGTVDNTPVGVGVAASGVFTSLAAVGNDALLYTSSNALSVPNATVVTVTNWTKTFDRLNTNFNATTGVFTAPVTGYYLVSAQVVYSAAANVVSSQFIVAAQVAGVSVAGAGGNNYALATGTSQIAVNFSSVVFATQGQAITIVTTQNTSSTRTLSSANLSITRIP